MAAPRAGLLLAGADDIGFETAHFQRELTKEVEDCRSLALSRDISELPAGNLKHESYEECRGDKVMRGWVYSYPSYGHSVPNVEFCELTADYFGLTIPVCVRNASARVPGARGADKFVGPRGAALMSADAKGDG
jgi:hypothetical protein